MSTDRIVTARLVLQAQLEVQRLGQRRVLALLESREPELAEYFLETSTHLYHEIFNTGATAKQARRIHDHTLTLVLVCLSALQKAHAALWQDDTDGAGLAQAEKPAPEPPASAPPAAP